MTLRGRFAPSPSGRMHLGNVYSAVLSYASVLSRGGEWVLRIEDLDAQRCKREYADTLEDDLRWLGFADYEGGSHGGSSSPYYQSLRSDLYREAYERLVASGLVYPCFCSRADILAARAPHATDGVVVYSGKCRQLTDEQRQAKATTRTPAQRLIFDAEQSSFADGHYGMQMCCPRTDCGDFIIRRADGSFAYQLAVVVDDALMGITEVVRGSDLLSSTHQQIYLYQKLGYPVPQFYHLPLLLSPSGCRLAKRDRGADMSLLRQTYKPQQIIGLIAFYAGLTDQMTDMSLAELVGIFSWDRVRTTDIVCDLH